MSRLAAAFCLTLLILLPLAAQQKPKNPPPPQFVKIPPAVAAPHLLKKVAPVYPAFAKAAGIQGVVRVSIGIYPDGRIHYVGVKSGWACLSKAAMNAAARYVYKPFEKNSHPVVAETTVDIVFKLSKHEKAAHLPPPPQLTLKSFGYRRQPTPIAKVSPELRKWVTDLADKSAPLCAEYGAPHPISRDALKAAKRKLLDATRIIQIPTRAPAWRLYFVGQLVSCVCGATGNCNVYLLEDRNGRIHLVAKDSGFGFHVELHKGSPYPDIFIANNMSAFESGVDGYVNVGGHWGLLYCGEILTEGKSNIHLCR